jgi:NitT/TauT family transport system ATP-binding protein
VTAALALERITCTFISRDDPSQRYTAVRDTTLVVQKGEFVSVVGPTGCGKSTLLNVAAGLLQPSAGVVRVFGEPLAGVNTRAGYLFQTDALMPWRKALANVTAGLEFRGLEREAIAAKGADWLRRVGLTGFGDRYPHQLSGGMKKRVALAQTLILDPEILLMEEAIALSDRVVVLSAGPETRPIGEYRIDLPRPRDVAEIRLTPRYLELHTEIWHAMKAEVLKGYAQQQRH